MQNFRARSVGALLVGLALGAAGGWIIFRSVRSPHPDQEQSAVSSKRRDADSLRAELAGARRERNRLSVELMTLESTLHQATPDPRYRAERESLVAEIRKSDAWMLVIQEGRPHSKLFHQSIRLTHRLIQIAIAKLETLNPPPTEAQRSSFDVVLANFDRAEAAEVDDDSLTLFQRELQRDRIEDEAIQKLFKAATPPQVESLDSLGIFGDGDLEMGIGLSGSSPSTIVKQVTEDWISDLRWSDWDKLEPAIRAFAEEFVERNRVIQGKAWDKFRSGEPLRGHEAAVPRLELFVEIQTRMDESLPLTTIQRKQLKNWSEVREYQEFIR
ncbi:MAG: hypothetical protein FD180_323 [Planctomycetota bacterium]|nr:MAG: hypothetical protein FD180_323 [Planctomycetota bacterium]